MAELSSNTSFLDMALHYTRPSSNNYYSFCFSNISVTQVIYLEICKCTIWFAGDGGGGTGMVMNSNIKRDDPSSAKRTLSSRLTFRPDNALKFLKKRKKDENIIEDIAEGW